MVFEFIFRRESVKRLSHHLDHTKDDLKLTQYAEFFPVIHEQKNIIC